MIQLGKCPKGRTELTTIYGTVFNFYLNSSDYYILLSLEKSHSTSKYYSTSEKPFNLHISPYQTNEYDICNGDSSYKCLYLRDTAQSMDDCRKTQSCRMVLLVKAAEDDLIWFQLHGYRMISEHNYLSVTLLDSDIDRSGLEVRCWTNPDGYEEVVQQSVIDYHLHRTMSDSVKWLGIREKTVRITDHTFESKSIVCEFKREWRTQFRLNGDHYLYDLEERDYFIGLEYGRTTKKRTRTGFQPIGRGKSGAMLSLVDREHKLDVANSKPDREMRPVMVSDYLVE